MIYLCFGDHSELYIQNEKKHARENGEEKIDEKERVIILHWKNPLYVSGVRYNDVFVVWDNIELNLKKKI